MMVKSMQSSVPSNPSIPRSNGPCVSGGGSQVPNCAVFSRSEQALQELRTRATLGLHPNLLQYFQAWEEGGQLFIQIELCQGNLEDFLWTHVDLPEEMLWAFLVDILLVRCPPVALLPTR